MLSLKEKKILLKMYLLENYHLPSDHRYNIMFNVYE